MMRLMMLCGVAVLTLGCGSGVESDAERSALLDIDRSWAAAIAAGDMDRVFSYWADDAVIYAAGIPAVRSKEAIRRDESGPTWVRVEHRAS